jgi:benzil reductase ((S)-benzoin forming)
MHLDLCNLDAVTDIHFTFSGEEESVVLINNAGWIGEIAQLGSGAQDHVALIESYNINLVAPTVLANQFIAQVKELAARKVVFNISSGAGRYPVAGWPAYCASKAGLDMLTRVINLENMGVEAYAVAPGVVDTHMQSAIRNANPKHFPDHPRFVQYHAEGKLRPAADVAKALIFIINHPEIVQDRVFSLRDLNL